MSTFDRAHVEAALRDRSLVRSVDVVPRGHVRIGTSFLYPDGGAIDLFVVAQDPLFSTYKLTDLGQTTSWLLDVQVRPWLSKKRQRFVEDALRLYGVTQSGGAFERPLASLDELMQGIVLLGQACVRVADLTYTRRSALTSVVTEQVEEVLSDAGLVYEANAELVGRQGARVRVDFVVEGARRRSALLTLASGNSSQAHVQANEIFARWYDLDVPERAEQRVTVFDDRVDVYRDQDLKRLRSVSDVVALSDPGALADLLAA
jgi:hypothetical protein